MIYKDGIWVREYIHDMPAEEQANIKAEITEALMYLGISGQKLNKRVEKIMSEGEVCDATDLIGFYKWVKESEVRDEVDRVAFGNF